MNDQGKSVLLARAMEWEIQQWPHEHMVIIRVPPNRREVEDFYTAPMEVVWLVLNWAAGRHDEIDDYSYPYTLRQSVESLFNTDYEIKEQLWAKDPAEAQRILLDTIFDAAVAAGLIEIGETKDD